MGIFVKVSKQTKQIRYTSYARICLYLDISKDLPNGIELSWDDEEWFQEIDYEQIPFECRCFHEHGNIYHDFPQNKKPRGNKDQERQDEEGFIKVASKKRMTKKVFSLEIQKKVQNHNQFESIQMEKVFETHIEGHLLGLHVPQPPPSLAVTRGNFNSKWASEGKLIK